VTNFKNLEIAMIGQTISHYKILEKLGGGGMGVVYKAEDTKLKRFVALKFLPPDLTRDEEAKQRFINEAQAASALDHPNICNIHEIDETADGQIFIAMAYYDGETLKKRVAKGEERRAKGEERAAPIALRSSPFAMTGGLPVVEVIDIAIQIAQGLAKAHEHGIVHRDIKPANVIVTNEGVVKIIDFGLAKLMGTKGITRTPSTLGTIAYMSPEQTQSETLDHRTDIWSLGVVLYEMLTGQLPFKGEYDQAVIYSIMNEEPQPVTTLRPELPIVLEQIVEKALRKDRSGRYQRMEELLADLRLLRRDSMARAILFKTRFAKRVLPKKSRALVFSGTILAAAILATIGYFFFSGQNQEKAERIPIAVVDVVNETKEEELDGLSGMLITALEQSRRLSVMTRSRMFDILEQMGKRDVERIDEALGRKICRQVNVQAMVIASIRKFGKLYTIDLKVFDPQKNIHLLATDERGEGQESIPAMLDRLAEKTRKGFHENTGEIRLASRKVAEVTSFNLEAYQHYARGDELINLLKWEEAQEKFKNAVALDSTFGLAYYRLAYAIGWNQNEVLAAEPLQKALALIDRIPEKERFLVRAWQARLEKSYEAGIAILKEMEQIYPNDKEMLFHIGDWSFHAGHDAVAAEYLEKVVALAPKFERALQHLAWEYRDMERFDKMIEFAKRYAVLVVSEDSYRLLADAYIRTGNFANALRTLQQARELFPENFRITFSIADVYTFQEDYRQAEAELKTLIQAHQPLEAKQFGYIVLAYFYPYLGKYREAIRVCEQGLASYKQTNDIEQFATRQIAKSQFMSWGWHEVAGALQEAEPTFRWQNRIESTIYWGFLADLYVAHGNYAVAESLATQKFDGFQSWASLFRSQIQSKRLDCASAKAYADSAIQQGVPKSNFRWIWIIYPLAQCYFATGELDRAAELLRHLQTVYDNRYGFRAVYYPKSFYLLGRIYEKKGERKLAIENYETLLNLWKDADQDLPELIEAKARLAALQSVTMK
jgi:serine/threonine protein kinase/predicted Zn-dependent protease